jgi:hypothetical protein
VEKGTFAVENLVQLLVWKVSVALQPNAHLILFLTSV